MATVSGVCMHRIHTQRKQACGKMSKKLFTLLDLCVSSLRRGHANLLCIVPILTDDPRRESKKDAIERRIVSRLRESDPKNGLNEVTHSQSLQTKCLVDACWVLAECWLDACKCLENVCCLQPCDIQVTFPCTWQCCEPQQQNQKS